MWYRAKKYYFFSKLQVNVKLSDYGIACYATSAGLMQAVGTPGYRAPELLLSSSCNMPYYNKVSVWCAINDQFFVRN